MHTTVVLYQSRYGAAKRYAAWLSGELGCDSIRVSDAVIEQIQKYDTVILGGGVYASAISGLEFLTKHADALRGKRLCVFAVGASPYGEETLARLRQKNMAGALSDVPLFYLRGAWNGSCLTLRDKMLCKLMEKIISKKADADCDSWERTLLQPDAPDADWTDRMYLSPMLAFLREQGEAKRSGAQQFPS